MARPDAKLWHHAITDELTSLAQNGTWHLVTLQPGRTPLTTTWVLKVKTDGDGQVERYKARLAFVTYAALVNYEVQQVDSKTAFLNAELNEEIYLEIPEGLRDDRQLN
eukprot:jgi/Pico_ML_1/51304/g2360.t1